MSLFIPIPTTALWRLCRPPTPRRATYPLPADYDAPPVPPLSFWIPETPSPLPTCSAVTTSPISSTPALSSCYSQPNDPTRPPHLDRSAGPPGPRSLLLPTVSPYLPAPPRSPISPTSPQSPHNPFLSPPVPHWNETALITLASPLLPASPLSIFDRAISPTSPTFLLSRAPSSPATPNWAEYTFLRTATPSLADGEREESRSEEKQGGDACADLSPTFLWPRPAPSLPRTIHTISPSSIEVGNEQSLQRSYSTTTTPPFLNSSAETSPSAPSTTPSQERKKLKVAFYHVLAARRAAAMQTLAAPTRASPLPKRPLAKLREKLAPDARVESRQCEPDRLRRISGWRGWISRA
ncbi:hypothetical protein ST47_g5624 [Ascochyta rabiei]|uniref:Uncharacterized protein n=2 Tax=Didymella rabiei TaxID=5454 RepID=A0A163DGQ4_DIDRA|nr:hypothetical protein ST47_g5624 [Ascochyta rabiei]